MNKYWREKCVNCSSWTNQVISDDTVINRFIDCLTRGRTIYHDVGHYIRNIDFDDVELALKNALDGFNLASI